MPKISGIINIANKSPLITEIRTKLIENRKKIKIIWIPNHSGININNYANQKAKTCERGYSRSHQELPNRPENRLFAQSATPIFKY